MAEIFKTPTTDQSRRFLISFLFGGSMTPGLRECVRRAYLDFSRTAHGVGKLNGSEGLKHSAHDLLESLLKEATERPNAWDRDSYDKWHESQCARICQHYAHGQFTSFRIGQAQKWLNMSVKYALLLNAVNMLPLEHAAALRSVAHVPIDDFIVKALQNAGAPELDSTWSRVTVYSKYFEFQCWFRKQFKDSTPLDVEFHLWIQEANKRRTPSP